MNNKAIHTILLAAVAVVIATSCTRDPKKPGKIFMPDMTYSNALETYSESVIQTPEGHKMSARLPVSGTIPRGMIPEDGAVRKNEAFLLSYTAKNHFSGKDWDAEAKRASESIKNPLSNTEENLANGKRLYNIHCAVCHGAKGEGDGQIVVLPDGSDGPYTAVPPAYSAKLKEITDGQTFYSISYGKGQMGAYGRVLSVNERWQVIHYIKDLAGLNKTETASN